MDKLAKKINESIKESEVYKKYLDCKKNIDNSEELLVLRCKMDEFKKKNCKVKDEKLINEYYELEKEYKSNVLVKEYECLKKEVYDLLADVSDILSFK